MARQWILIPGGAAVLRAEYLAAPRRAVDLVGITGMQPHRHHGAMGLHAVVEALPGLAQVLTTVERAVPATRRRAEAGIYYLGLLRRYLHVTGIRQRGIASHLHILPIHAVVGTPEQSHTHGQENSPRLGRTHGERMGIHHALDLRVAADFALQVRPASELDEMGAAVSPGLAAVQAAHQPTDLHPAVDLVPIAATTRQADQPRGQTSLYPLTLLGSGQPPPGITTIVAAIRRCWGCAQVHGLRILGVKQNRPRDHTEVRKAQFLPVITTVCTAIRSVL